jgi:hypothetical protein
MPVAAHVWWVAAASSRNAPDASRCRDQQLQSCIWRTNGGSSRALVLTTVVLAMGAVLVAVVLWAFFGEGVQWATWWAPLLAVTMATGALVGNIARISR